MKYKHNKRINTGLIYEMLIRFLAESFIDKDNIKSDAILSMIKKYYSPGTILGEEINVFSIILNNKVSSHRVAQELVQEVFAFSEKLDNKKINAEKSRLLSEIDAYFSEGFFNTKIKNYKVYANVHQCIDLNRRKKLSLEDKLKKIKLEEKICEFVLNNDPPELKKLEASKKYNNLVFKLVIESYNKKYDNKLTKGQKTIVKKMVESNDVDFRKFIEQTMKSISDRIKSYKQKTIICENKVLKVKFEQISKKWKNDSIVLRRNPITESALTTILKYVGLLDEITT